MGTQKDNIRDMDRKGRRVKGASPGERNGASKLRASDVKKMRFMRGTQKEIAAKFGVTDSLVRKILAGRLWKLSSAGWTGEGARFSRIGERHWKAKLEPSDVFRIRELSAEGASTRAISDQFGVGLNQVRCIVQRVSWRHL
jgi:DNA invertase Pin-like site-specific DNA recombinase